MAKKSKKAINMAEVKVTTWEGENPTPVDPKKLQNPLMHQNHDSEPARIIEDGREVLVDY